MVWCGRSTAWRSGRTASASTITMRTASCTRRGSTPRSSPPARPGARARPAGLGYAAPLMSRTTLLGLIVLAVVLALAVPSGAPAARRPALDRLPQALPAAGPHAATAAVAPPRWLIGARTSAAAAPLAGAPGARPPAVPGTSGVDPGPAPALAGARRH